ncbi:hypothetical protein OIN59_21280 [Acidovorax sp. D2M1]|uniref:Trypsin-like peptidase domain-containing protein n=1 Tax=Acidovorax benzenivorans TaxID=2987520 RepID=A0ABT5S216_9BURK|nr:hypothetical protein [Acidovorax benzenivorans]MDD2179979.1 hypothetical protein [Acidovorax benzenivorans]
MARSAASKLLERRSAARDQTLIDDARTHYQQLDSGEQFALALQLAACRRAEMTQRYRSVVHVVGGVRRRTMADGDRLQRSEPCVVFVVRRKQAEEDLGPSQCLPRELLTPAMVGGRLLICAVPTDVQQESRFLDARAQAATAIHSVSTKGVADWGALACVVQGDDGDAFAIAPAHVLSPYPPLNGRGIAEENAKQFRVVRAEIPTDTVPCLEGTVHGGRLAPYPATSFDVQFAKVTDLQRVSEAFSGIRWSVQHPFAVDLPDLFALMQNGVLLEIMVPSNHKDRLSDAEPVVLFADVSTYCENCPLTYVFESPGKSKLVLHSVLELQLELGHATLGGDSGSPVVVPVNDGYVFVGMHIAGNIEACTAWVIPAWELFDPARYASVDGSMPSGAISLFNP